MNPRRLLKVLRCVDLLEAYTVHMALAVSIRAVEKKLQKTFSKFVFLNKNLKNPDFRLSHNRKLLPFSLSCVYGNAIVRT